MEDCSRLDESPLFNTGMVDNYRARTNKGAEPDLAKATDGGIGGDERIAIYDAVMIDHRPRPQHDHISDLGSDVQCGMRHDQATLAHFRAVAHISTGVNESRQVVAESAQFLELAKAGFKVFIANGDGEIIFVRGALTQRLLQCSDDTCTTVPIIDKTGKVRTTVNYQFSYNGAEIR